ncbi:MAG: helix-turn-helix domain-containing protein [Firmicutes bacterium]|nr:helix-turn-helix domain-containing protein [Bacillota bacterium]
MDLGTLRVKEVAELLQVTPWQVYEMVKQGRIPAVHVGRAVRIPRKQFAEWVAKGGDRGEHYVIRCQQVKVRRVLQGM